MATKKAKLSKGPQTFAREQMEKLQDKKPSRTLKKSQKYKPAK